MTGKPPKTVPPATDDRCDWQAPILIVGAPRSGTTRITLALAAHQRLAITNEANVLPMLRAAQLLAGLDVNEHIEEGALRLVGCIHPAHADRFGRLHERHAFALLRDFYRETFAGKRFTRFGDKLVFAPHISPDLVRAFPRIQFVHVVRDPRHGLLSQLRFRDRQRQRGLRVDHQSFEELCRAWALHQEQLLDALTPENSIRVDYRQMLRAPRRILAGVLQFLGVPPDEEALRTIAERPAGKHATTGSETASLEGWREAWSEEQLATIERVCGPVARRLELPAGTA